MDDLVNTLDRVAEGRHRSGAGRGGATTTTASGGTLEDPVRIEPLGMGDVASAVELVTRVLRVKPGDRGEQFAFDIDDDARQMFVAKANDQVIAYGRVAGLAAGEAAPGSPPGYYLTGVLVEPAWRGRGIATALTQARLDWVFGRTDRAFYVAGAENTASLRLHAALGFLEMARFESERSASGVDVLSQLHRARNASASTRSVSRSAPGASSTTK